MQNVRGFFYAQEARQHGPAGSEHERGNHMNEQLMTVQEVATLLAVTAKTVYRMIEKGDLPALKVGSRAVRVPQSSIQAVLTPAHPAAVADQVIGKEVAA